MSNRKASDLRPGSLRDAIDALVAAGVPAVDGVTLDTNGSGSSLEIKTGGVHAAQIGAGEVVAAAIGASAVVAASLKGALRTGTIPLPLGSALIITSNDTSATTEGGVPDNNTSPSLKRVNAATDKNLRLAYAASSSGEIQWGPFPVPVDLDAAQPMVFHALAGSAGATDTPVLTVSFFQGVGGDDEGGNTAAVDNTAGGKHVTASILGADIGVYPASFSVGVTPGAHTTDILYIYAAWLEYTRKDN